MGNKNNSKEFLPAVAITPGDTIRDNMDYLGMNQIELATRLGITTKHLSNVINGNAPITYETAIKLESVIGPSAQFWMNLEVNYQLNKIRIEQEGTLATDLKILKEIPYKEMSGYGWLDTESDRIKKVINCREFFGVANLSLVKTSYVVMYRKQKQLKDISNMGVLAWLRKAEVDGLAVEVEEFNKKRLKSYIPKFRELTLKKPEEFYPTMKKLCAECGISLVLVKALPKTYICGATIWRKDNPIVALSVRGKRADIFWFTFFHELAHLLNHSKKELHVNYDENIEDSADSFAGEYLIPAELYDEFINKYDYTDKKNIIEYAKKVKIGPCILVGRLQHDSLIPYSGYSDLRPSFEIV